MIMKNDSCGSSCQIEAVVNVDDRGQIVIPKDVRAKFGIDSGDKFALISCTQDDGSGAPCCFTLVKTEYLKGMVQKALGPMFAEIVGG